MVSILVGGIHQSSETMGIYHDILISSPGAQATAISYRKLAVHIMCRNKSCWNIAASASG